MNQKAQKPIYKKWWFWVLVFLFLLVMGNMNTTIKTEMPAQKTEEVIDEDHLSSLIKSKVSSNYTLKNNDGYYEIVYDLDKTPYDYTDYVSQALTHCLIVSKYLFENTNCSQLRMDMRSDGDVVTSLIISKDGFNKHSWSDIAYTKEIYDDIQDSFDKFYVENMLMKDVVSDEVMIKDMLED